MDDDDFWVPSRSIGRTGRAARRLGAGRGSDPFVRRLVVLGLAFALLLPVFMALRGNGSPVSAVPAPGAVAVMEPAGVQVPSAVQSMSAAPAAAAEAANPAVAAAPQATTAPTLARRPSCASPYTVVRGDFWLRIARIHGVRLSQLLQANNATVSTPLYPGSKVCLPSGATRPVTSTTKPPTATTQVRPTATTQPRTATTTRPTTATTAAPPATAAPRTYTRQQVIDIIRYVWPDELEDRAIQIATRESNLLPTARSSCCSGLFQIYYSVHKGWLAGLGITSAQMLYDPVLNAKAALALYQRAGGWGPWGG
jgi:LysM repeat protein